MSQDTLVMIIAAAAVAMIIGFLIGKSVGSSSSQGSAAKRAQKELDDYKAAVSEHFGKTADLVDNLTESYKEVFEHLGSSARTLLSEEEVNKHIASRAEKAVTLTYAENADTQNTAENDNPMQQAQEAIQVEDVVDVVKEDAEKMAESLTESEKTSEKTENSTNKA